LHKFSIKMNDSIRNIDFNHVLNSEIEVAPGQIVLVRFDNANGFTIQ
jgi:hypothetical protein